MKTLAPLMRPQLSTDFERALFDASLLSFEDHGNPLRTNNFAYSIRELSRHVLKRLAPDEHITKCCWYKVQINELGKTTIPRTQRIQFAVQGGLSESFVNDTLQIELDDMRKNFNAAVANLSKLTHIEESVFALEEFAATKYASETLEAFSALFSTIDDCRSQVASAVESHISKKIFAPFIVASFNEIDELATHHQIESAQVEGIHVHALNHENIVYQVDGYIDCELQYGSSSDVRRGDGAVHGASFPFSCRFVASVTDALHPVLQVHTLKIDNSSWYE